MANADTHTNTNELQSQLNELESYIAELEDFIREPVCLISPDGIITDSNRAFATTVNRSQSDLVGTKFVALFADEQAGRQLLTDAESARGDEQSEQLSLDGDADDQPLSVHVQVWRNAEGGVRGYLATVTNEHDQSASTRGTATRVPSSEAELDQPAEMADMSALVDQIKEQQMRTQSVLYNITDGLIFLNADRKIEMVNPSAATMLDVHSSDLIGKQLGALESNEVIDELQKLLLENDELSREDVSVGAEAYFEVTTTHIGNEENNSQRVVILHDISEKRKIEEMKLEFASVAAHQMRTPLSSIRWSFEILSKKLEDDELLQAAQRGYKSTQQVLEVVDQLLNLDRLEEGDSGYNFDSLDVVELLDELVKSESESQAVLDQPEIDYEKPVDPIPNVRGDETKLKIVFKNLIDNALKYTNSDAEIEIRVSIKMTSGYGGDVVLITVADEGIGIPEEEQDKIFSKFYRADNATDTETEGTGVGLYITKEIVEAHNGKIWFESAENEGTTFFVQLPMASDN